MAWLRRLLHLPAASPHELSRTDGEPQDDHAEPAFDDVVVELPITDALDLHPFRPNETADVLREYLDAAIAKGLRELRIIHGRGIGTQREIVRKVLSRDSRVISYADAPADRGGWGATVVELRVAPAEPP